MYIEKNISSESEIILSKITDNNRIPSPGFLTDFTGTKVHGSFLPKEWLYRIGIAEPPPPRLEHSGYLEYLGTALSLNKKDKHSFSVLELGACNGWWSAIAGVVAKRLGFKKIILGAVEADLLKYNSIKDHYHYNNLYSDADCEIVHNIYHKAVSCGEQIMWFPKSEIINVDFGQKAENINPETDYRGAALEHIEVPAISLSDLLNDFDKLDLLHVDIQGSEFDVLNYAIDQINKKVSVIVIGTHSRKIEGQLIELFYKNKWELAGEETCLFNYNVNIRSLTGMTICDGTQIWINSK